MNSKVVGQRIFISGGAGFIANKIISRLIEANEITVYDNFTRDTLTTSTLSENSKIKIISGDVLDLPHLKKSIAGHSMVIHAAAIAGIDSVVKKPVQTMLVNMSGTSNILEAASELKNLTRVVNFSTSEVFGPNSFKSRESDSTVSGSAGEARWTYAVSKLAGEHLALAYHRERKLPVVNIRPFNVYGPGQTGEGALSIFIRKAMLNEDILIDGDGTQIRAWCFVDDFVDGLVGCLENPRVIGHSINIGNARATMTILGLANTVCRVLNSTSRIIHHPPLSEDIAVRVPSLEKVEELLGFKARIDLDDGIRKTADWIRSQD
jgi:UDP-glucose 4-epimerase